MPRTTFAGFWHFIIAIAAVRLFSLLQMCKYLTLQAIDVQSDLLTMNSLNLILKGDHSI